MAHNVDRRRHQRIRAPFYCRPAGQELLAKRMEPIDISLGGLRIYSDEAYRVGSLLRLDISFSRTPPATFTAEVLRIAALRRGAHDRFDVGLAFTHATPEALKLLETVLDPRR